MSREGNRDIIEGMPSWYSSSIPKRTNHLFCIGINKYEHVSKLNNAVRDIETFAELMTEKYNFQQEHIRILKDEEATRRNIISQLRNYAEELTDQDNLLLYFSGHGVKDKLTEEGFWIPVEGEKQDISSWLANDMVMRCIQPMKAHHVFLLIDACFSGSFFVQAKSHTSKYDNAASRFAITSGAEEIVSDGPEGQHSPFAGSVLRYLSRSQEKAFGVGSMFEEIRKNISSQQKPQARHLSVRGQLYEGEFVFYQKQDEEADWRAAHQVHTPRAYEDYLTKYGEQARYAAEARLQLLLIQEETDWERAKARNTATSYLKYITSYPEGKHHSLAIQHMEEREEEAEWKKVSRRNIPSAYLGYLQQYPSGKFAGEANDELKRLLAEEERKEAEAAKKEQEERKREQAEQERRIREEQLQQAEAARKKQEQQKREQGEKARRVKLKHEQARKLKEEQNQNEEQLYQGTNIPKEKNPLPYVLGGIGVILVAFFLFRLTPTSSPSQKGVSDSVSPVIDSLTIKFDSLTAKEAVLEIETNMIPIKGGSFKMGSNNGDNDEKPIHEVNLSTFYMSKFEITQAQYTAIMGDNPSYFHGCGQCPVEKVSWHDAQTFLKKLSELSGKSYRLPTEAEWEYAAKGGQKSRGYLYVGGNDAQTVGWYWKNSGDKKLDGDWSIDRIKKNNCKTHPVGSKQPNELGLYDMSGNVWEWCADWYGDYPTNSQKDPQGPENGTIRMLRGGGWSNGASGLRVANRNSYTPDSRDLFSGFRPARN